MAHPAYGIDGEIMVWIDFRIHPLYIYCFYYQEVEKKVLPLCLSGMVAPEILPGRDGIKGKKMINGQWSMINAQLSLVNDHWKKVIAKLVLQNVSCN